MQTKLNWTGVIRLVAGITVLVGAAALVSAPKSPFTKQDKAYYADPNQVNFVRPGLVLKVVSAEIASDGTIKARVKFSDPKGVPLDKDGIESPAAISNGSPGMIAAYIPKGQAQYTSYTTRVQTSPITGKSATQAGTDSGGTWAKVADGEYTYTFRTKAPSGWDKTATHAVGIYGNRNLTEFGYPIALADDVLAFVPDGSAKPVTRDVIKTQSCMKCHVGTFAFHGTTGRVSMPMCVLCHQPQTTDPDTGNTVDMAAMAHSIHMGDSLPVKPYKIIGNAQSVNDYSEVAIPTDKRNCTVCHEQDTNAAQAMNYVTRPTRLACGGCHNNVNFATGENHLSLPQISDNQCASCHIPQGELEFDASIMGAHTIPYNSRELGGIQWSIVKVDNGVAGKAPTVTFTLKDKAGNALAPSDFARLNIVLGGPTTDYTAKIGTATGNGYTSEDALKATGSNGTYSYTFATAIPASAKGSFSVGLEGRRVQVIYAGTKKEQSVQYGSTNAVFSFSVDGSKLEQRRVVVDMKKCLECHVSLRLHGENRVDKIEQCVICHNPIETDVSRRPAAQLPAQSIDMRQMIHNIHGGEELKTAYGVEDYIVYGFGGSVNNFSHVVYPGLLSRCDACHVNNSQSLPLSASHAKVVDPRGYLNPTGAQAAACLSCHKSLDAASHALANTTSLGESCGACHGPNSEFSVSKVHAQ